MKEADLKRCVEDYLQIGTNQGRWYHDRLNSGSTIALRGNKPYRVQLCKEGTADFYVIKKEGDHARVIFLELKGAKGKTSPAQNAFKVLVEGQGAEYSVVRDVEELITIIGDKND